MRVGSLIDERNSALYSIYLLLSRYHIRIANYRFLLRHTRTLTELFSRSRFR